MKKILFMLAVFMMLSVTLVSAKVYVSTAVVEDEYDGVLGVVRFKNTMNSDLDDVKVSIVIPELGEYYTQNVGEVKSEDRSSTIIHGMTEPGVSGDYLARIVIYDEDGTRRVKHRYVFFD